MKNAIEKAKKIVKENSNKLWLAAVSVATLGGTYYYGKSKGEQHFEVLVDLKPDVEPIRLSERSQD